MLVLTTPSNAPREAISASAANRLMDQGTELARLGIWPQHTLERLGGSWITTAAQVVAIAATDAGLTALSAQCGLPRADLIFYVERTRQALPASVRERLSKPADTSQFGRGAK